MTGRSRIFQKAALALLRAEHVLRYRLEADEFTAAAELLEHTAQELGLANAGWLVSGVLTLAEQLHQVADHLLFEKDVARKAARERAVGPLAEDSFTARKRGERSLPRIRYRLYEWWQDGEKE